jgi:hypothetical protein
MAAGAGDGDGAGAGAGAVAIWDKAGPARLPRAKTHKSRSFISTPFAISSRHDDGRRRHAAIVSTNTDCGSKSCLGKP